MFGGFFRETSADQGARFSNKLVKLSSRRNSRRSSIIWLEMDGKQIQIQLTGFMEMNTGTFMRELWGLLLSTQNNISVVPQQFLDATEEETRKKKEEADEILQEIQKRRDRDEREPER